MANDNPYLDRGLIDFSTAEIAVNPQYTDADGKESPQEHDKNNHANQVMSADHLLQSILDLDEMDLKNAEGPVPVHADAAQAGIIHLNVGGVKYETTKSTLCKYPSSTLCKLVTNSHGKLFVDRDGQIFRYVLNYLRDGTCIVPHYDHRLSANRSSLLNQLLMEAKYYGLSAMVDELIIFKLGSVVLSTSSNKSQQKKHIHRIRELISAEYANLARKMEMQAVATRPQLNINSALTHEWKMVYSYDVTKYSSPVPPLAMLQSICSSLRSVLVLFVCQNQMFAFYCYEEWLNKNRGVRGKNFVYFLGPHLNDGMHKCKFEQFHGKKFVCTYHDGEKAEIVAQYTQPKSQNSKSRPSGGGKCYQIAFSFDTHKYNRNLVLTNLKGDVMKALADDKDSVAVNWLEVYHVAFCYR